MLRALTFVTVRQEQHEARVLLPLRTIGDHELIDDRRGDVGEIAELRFPAHQRVGGCGAESVLEAHHCGFAERTVGDFHPRLRIRHMLQRRVGVAVVRVVQHRLTMTEGAALDVLTGETHMHSVFEQRAKRQRFGVTPIDRLFESFATAFECPGETRIDCQFLRPGEQRFVQRLQTRGGHGGLHCFGRRWIGNAFGVLFGSRIVDRVENPLELLRELIVDRIDVGFRDDTITHQARTPDLTRRRMRLDARVQLGLGEERLVGLVVTVTAIANEVDQEVLAEACPICNRDAHRHHAGFGVIRIDMHNRHVESFRQIAGIVRAAGIDRIGSEADLVVRDDVQRAAYFKGAQAAHVERLGHNTLANERGVAVHADGEHRLRIALA